MQVSMREFKTHLSKYVHQAHAGQPLEVTVYKKGYVKIVGITKLSSSTSATFASPVNQALSGERLLLASGLISWNGQKPKGADLVLSQHKQTMADLVLEQRN